MSDNLFDLAEEYDQMLNQGLSLSGEGKAFFVRGRIDELRRQLAATGDPVRHVLDFGCGIGDTSVMLAEAFPEARITGVDNAEQALEHARMQNASEQVRFGHLDDLPILEPVDLCYVNGVFHHILPADRPAALASIHGVLRPGGLFALFENNPWNPGTRLVMSRIPFDRDAQTLSPPVTRRLLMNHSFVPVTQRFLFYFPRALRWLRPVERFLTRLPLGAQYLTLARKA